MRLSPKSIFFGLVALGLPLAVTIGWSLGGPAATTPPAVAAPAGAGGMGEAPVRDTTPEPVRAVTYGSQPPRATVAPPSASSSAPVTTLPSSAAPSGPPSLSLPPLPPLTDPPVPTPTMVTSAPPPPTATPPSSAPSATPLPFLR